MAKDLKDAALDAFKRSAMSADTAADKPKTEPSPTGAGDGKKTSAPRFAKSGKKKSARAMTSTVRHGAGTTRKAADDRTATHAKLATASPAAQTRRPGTLPSKPGVKESHTDGRGFQWLLVAINLLLLILVVILLTRTGAIEKKVAEQGKRIEAQNADIETIAKSADEARKNAQAKFGVYRDEKKKLHGVFVNYRKPSIYRSIDLSREPK